MLTLSIDIEAQNQSGVNGLEKKKSSLGILPSDIFVRVDGDSFDGASGQVNPVNRQRKAEDATEVAEFLRFRLKEDVGRVGVAQ